MRARPPARCELAPALCVCGFARARARAARAKREWRNRGGRPRIMAAELRVELAGGQVGGAKLTVGKFWAQTSPRTRGAKTAGAAS